jgi:hypothetical protein
VSVNGAAEVEMKVRGWEFDYDAGVDEDAAVLGSRKLDSLGIGDNSASISFSPVAGAGRRGGIARSPTIPIPSRCE